MLTSYKHERHDHEDSLQLEIRQYSLYRLRGCYKPPARAKIGSSRATYYRIIRASQSPGKQQGRMIYSTMNMTQARPKAMQANMQIRPACTCICLSRARRTHTLHFFAIRTTSLGLLTPTTYRVVMMITAKNSVMTTATAAMTIVRKAWGPSNFINAD